MHLPPHVEPPPPQTFLPTVPPLPTTIPYGSSVLPQNPPPLPPPAQPPSASLVSEMPSPIHAKPVALPCSTPATFGTSLAALPPQTMSSGTMLATFGTGPAPPLPQAMSSSTMLATFGTSPAPPPLQTVPSVGVNQVMPSPTASIVAVSSGTMPSIQTGFPLASSLSAQTGIVVPPVAYIPMVAQELYTIPIAAQEPPKPSSPAEAAFKIQRWWKSQQRRERFLKMIRRAIRRRRYLNERRSLAQRLHTQEVEAEEMKAKLMRPKGHRLVGEWQDTRTEKAATRVQSLWRSLKAKKQYVKRTVEMDREAAARKLQAFLRKRSQRRQPNPLLAAARQNPASQPMTAERLFKHEETILKKVKEYTATYIEDTNPITNAAKIEELRRKAIEKYRDFIGDMPDQRADLMRTLLHKEQTRQMIYALEGRGWDNPLPYGVCSAALLRDAEELHRERKKLMEREIWAGVHGTSMSHTGTAVDAATDTVAVESQVEAAEADELLWGLEKDLGYDFSARLSNIEHSAASKNLSSALFQQPLFGGALR